MAHSPIWEDYQRMGLRFALSLEGKDGPTITRAFSTFGLRYANERDALPQTDADRAFHLVTLAADIIDQELPVSDDARAEEIIADGHRMLDEALSLDPNCHDALRMQALADCPSFAAALEFLEEHEGQVREACEKERRSAEELPADERRMLACDLAMRPYLRWLACEASEALICGRNRHAIEICRRALATDPRDTCDVRFTAALAFAKLEDEEGLDAFLKEAGNAGAPRVETNAWTLMARLALAYKRRDDEGCERHLRALRANYRRGCYETLFRQIELPEGVFARLVAEPFSEDELIICVSESTVLLQEGLDYSGHGTMGSWLRAEVATHLPAPLVMQLLEEERLRNQDLRDGDL